MFNAIHFGNSFTFNIWIMKPLKQVHGWRIEEAKYNHPQRSSKTRRLYSKRATKEFLRKLDKSNNENINSLRGIANNN